MDIEGSRLQAWFHTPLARSALACERLVAARMAERLFGARLLQIGLWNESTPLLEACRVGHSLVVNPRGPVDMVAELDALPVRSASVDAVVMPHTLECVPNPHGTLREAERVLVDGGHLLLTGFSRYSLWGFRELLRRPPFGADSGLIAERRVGDWMRLLGFELMELERYHYRPPVNHDSLLRRTRWLEHWGRSRLPGPWPAGGYAALFRKQAVGATFVRPLFGQRQPLGPAPVASPYGRSWNRSCRQRQRTTGEAR